ncbi:SGNH/GDSL hydrolase family protein [Ornithinimicrobium sp. Y1847]|uniref:SGNH/GDSL hydrolase family protein n=1 Tax=Ornithinimicrobium sp. Y1847 TaxID=3405419 RepID=UPI003B66EFCD
MRWQNLGLAVLAVLTAALVWWTFRSAQEPISEPMVGTTDGAAGTQGAAPQNGQGSDEVGETTSATEEPTVEEQESPLAAAAEILASGDPVVVAALGDSTGNQTWEWPYLWAGQLGQGRDVTVHFWDSDGQAGYFAPEAISTDTGGDDGAVDLWIGHQPGAGAAYPAERLDTLIPEDPDLVILNYGHNDPAGEVGASYELTLTALRERFGDDLPILVTLQNPQVEDSDSDVREEIRAFAGRHDLGIIDVADAFLDQEDPDALLGDDVHPDEAGQQLWAETVATSLSAP